VLFAPPLLADGPVVEERDRWKDPTQKFPDDEQCRRGMPLGRFPSQPIFKLQKSQGRIAGTSTGAASWRAARRPCSRNTDPPFLFCCGVPSSIALSKTRSVPIGEYGVEWPGFSVDLYW